MLNIGEFARLGQVTPRMLRHYDELGLLRPDRVDSSSGYRIYSVQQSRNASVGSKPTSEHSNGATQWSCKT